MKKIIGISIPFIAACLLLGIIFFFAGQTNQAAAASIRNATQGTITVTTLDDELVDDGLCSLREAIRAANQNKSVDSCPAGGVLTDTITFDVMGTIVLGYELPILENNLVWIDGEDAITISGNGITQVFINYTDAQLILQGLTISNGHGTQGGAIMNFGVLVITDTLISDSHAGSGGGIYNFDLLIVANSTISNNSTDMGSGNGGGIYNSLHGTLVILDSTVSGNSAEGGNSDGGGIDNDGDLFVRDSTVSGNTANRLGGGINSYYGKAFISNSVFSGNHSVAGWGGGIYLDYGTMEIVDSSFTGNSEDWSGGGGGGISNSEVMTVTNSTFSGNHAGNGGGIGNGGTLIINKSTFSANSSDYSGGGISNGSRLYLTNSTISGNSAATTGGGISNTSLITITLSTIAYNSASNAGGGIYNYSPVRKPVLTDTIISNSTSGGNCAGEPIIDNGHNLEDANSCGFDPLNGSLPNTDPMLGPLQDNGGPTFTHALLPDSKAIDAGEPVPGVYIDQRGYIRPMDGNNDGTAAFDIGAYERNGPIIYHNPYYLPLVYRHQ